MGRMRSGAGSGRCPLAVALVVVLAPIACTRTAPRGTEADRAPALDAPAPQGSALDAEDARARRAELVRSIAADGYVKSERVLEAMRAVPRHLFVPGASLDDAYDDAPHPIGHGQTISQPRIVARMTEELDLRATDRVLEIGTGSGYQAAVLSVLVREVYTIEIVRELGEQAERRLRDLGYANVHVRVGDGYAGWPDQAPFDRVILTAAPPDVPRALTDQLSDGGVLVAPVGERQTTQWLVRVTKKDGRLSREPIDLVRFVPMVPGR